MKYLGVWHYLLGIEFMQNWESIMITQKNYIENILRKFNMQESKSKIHFFITMWSVIKDMCPKTEYENYEMNIIPYRQLMGSLL